MTAKLDFRTRLNMCCLPCLHLAWELHVFRLKSHSNATTSPDLNNTEKYSIICRNFDQKYRFILILSVYPRVRTVMTPAKVTYFLFWLIRVRFWYGHLGAIKWVTLNMGQYVLSGSTGKRLSLFKYSLGRSSEPTFWPIYWYTCIGHMIRPFWLSFSKLVLWTEKRQKIFSFTHIWQWETFLCISNRA